MKTEKLMIVEGIESVFSYHLGLDSKPSQSLCGRWTMPTKIHLDQYNSTPDHLHEKWCQKCLEIRDAR